MPLPQAPALTVAKQGVLDMTVVPPANRPDVGDKVAYTVTAANVGNVTLTGVTVSDPKLGTPVCVPPQPASLAPGAQMVCTGTYTLTQADVNNGQVVNTATADSDQTPPSQTTVTVPLPQASALTLAKTGTLDMTVVAPANRADVGDRVDYTLTATNTGNVTLTGVTIVDPKLGALVCTPPQPASLAPGGTLVCTGSYTLTQADVNTGQVTNTATTDSDQTAPTQAADTVPLPQAPALTLTKHGVLDTTVAGPANRADVGDKVNYTLTAANVGNVTLTGVTVVDPKLGALVCVPPQPASLAPGAQIVCTGSYTLTQADLNAGQVVNTATADSDQTAATQAGETVPLPQAPALIAVKNGVLDTTVVAPNGRADVGDKVNYTLTAANVGNVTLTGVTIVDPKLGALACVPPQPATLAPGATLACTGSYTLTQADLNTGRVDNTATADSDQTLPRDAVETVPLPQAPALALTKEGTLDMTVVAPNGRADVGDKVNYTLTAANVGNVTLTGVTVVDAKLGTLACAPTQPASLAPGAEMVCTGSHTLTQADLNSGVVGNTATADSGQTAPTDTTETVPLPQAPALTLVKNGTIDPTVVAPTGRADVGDKVNYTLTASNVGNVTLTGVTIADPKLGALACAPTQPATLAPGATLVCTGSYTLTQADLDTGRVDNTATADSDQTAPTQTPSTVPLPQVPSLSLAKSGTLDSTVVAPNNRADVGDKVHYTLTATNAGNVTLTGVTISDPKLGALACTPTQPATLAPGAKLVCTGSYTLTQADLNGGTVGNTATGDSDQTPPTNAAETVPLPQDPALTLTKHGVLDTTVVAPGNRADVGDKVNYTLTATNAGNVTLSGVTVSDPKLGALVCAPPQPASLAPGAQIVCTAAYTLTQADLDSGQVQNTATADSDQTPATQTPSTVPLPQAATLALSKTGTLDPTVVDPTNRADPGDTVSYTLTATNTGNVTLTGVTVVDAKLGALACTPAQPATLAPGAQIVCTGTYTLTQADLNAGQVVNTATGDTDQTPPTQGTETVPLPQAPTLTLTKQGTIDPTVVLPNARADAGDSIDYTLTATNTGNVTLTGVTVTDPKLGALVCAPAQPATLLPGEHITCTGSYTLTQADLNTGQVQNTGTADSDQTPPTQTPSTVPVPQSPALALLKQGTLDTTVVAPAQPGRRGRQGRPTPSRPPTWGT